MQFMTSALNFRGGGQLADPLTRQSRAHSMYRFCRPTTKSLKACVRELNVHPTSSQWWVTN